MSCPVYSEIKGTLLKIDQAAEIEKAKEDPLRYDVWGTTPKIVNQMLTELSAESLPSLNNSVAAKWKIEGLLKSIRKRFKIPSKFMEEIIANKNNIRMTIALHEVMESVKGESDKARNLDIDVNDISTDGILPSLPLARLAASIGRKIAFQQGVRFHNTKEHPATPVEIEALYYKVGMPAIKLLEKRGYLTLDMEGKGATIQDYIYEDQMYEDFPTTDLKVSGVSSVSLNTKTLGIKPDSQEATYFLDRGKSTEQDNSPLFSTVKALTAVRHITQPSKYSLPHTEKNLSKKELDDLSDPSINPDEKTLSAIKKLYDTPLKVHGAVHDFMQLLHEEVVKQRRPASAIIQEIFKGKPELLRSLFGIKDPNRFSVDKKQSTTGQTLSKTTAIDDLAEYYDLLVKADSPAELHLALKTGRNARLYYLNAVLNPHGSKQSRYMLTGGEQSIEVGSEEYNILVQQVAENLGDFTYKDITAKGNKDLDKALKLFNEYSDADTLAAKLGKLSELPALFPGKDYATLLTNLQAVQDIRSAGDTVKTEFMGSYDATASGGTLTLLQALGSNENIKKFFENIGLLVKDDGSLEVTLSDLYQIMTDAIQDFVTEDPDSTAIAPDLGVDEQGLEILIRDTLDLLFDGGKEGRELSKGPTTTFVYGQGEKGAIESISTALADRIIENLDDPKTRAYLAKLLKDSSFLESTPTELKAVEGLYKDIKVALAPAEGDSLSKQLYSLLNTSLKDKFLREHQERSEAIYDLIKETTKGKVLKVLPAGAVLDGKVPTKDLAKYGMAVAKIFEIMHTTPDGEQVLTRKELLQKTVMDVSTIHGIDAGLLYHAIDDSNFGQGLVVVHDEVRGSIKDVKAVKDAYIKKAKEVLVSYDIHDQLLQALAVYHPEVTEDLEYKALRKDVDTTLKTKGKLASNFNDNTDALIGDGNAAEDFAKGKKKGKKVVKTTKDYLESLGKDSELIQKFLGVFNTKVKAGKTFSYSPETDTLSVGSSKLSRKETIEAVEHEIVHAATLSEIRKALIGEAGPTATNDVRYFQKTLKRLKELRHKASEDVQVRIDYILSQPTEEQQLAEFVAVMQSEKEIASGIYKLVDNRTLRHKILQFINKVKLAILALTDADFDKEVDSQKLYGALQRTLDRGIAARVENQQETEAILKSIKEVYGYGKATSPIDVDFLNAAVARLVMDKAEERGKGILSNAHNILSQYPLYTEAVDKLRKIYNSSEDLQQLLHTITGEDVDKKKKADALAKFAQVSAQRNDVIQKGLSEFEELTKDLSDKEKKTLDTAILGIPLHDYFVQAKELDTVAKIDAEVARLEKELEKFPKALSDIDSLVRLNLHDDASGGVYNLQSYGTDSKYHLEVRKLLALKSIQDIGTKEFTNLLANKALMAKVEDYTVANHLSLMNFKGSENLRSTGVPHSFSEGVEPRAITVDELPSYEYGENTGWKVIKKPTKSTLGLVYREVIDSTSIPGAFTDVKMSSADLDVTSSKKSFSNVVSTPNGYRMILTQEQRDTMGALGAVQSLVRGTAHAMSIQESQIIREEMLKAETTMQLTASNLQDLQDTVEDSSRENPWFLKAKGISYSDLPASIKARYKPVGNRASDVQGFNKGVDFVRKDISHWLLGGASSSPFTSPKWKWALRITKDLVSMAKIGMVVLNPGKIARDNISNVAYLGVMGVSPSFAANSYKDIMEEFGEYTEAKNELLALKVSLLAKPNSTKLQKKAKSLQKRLDRNPISSIEAKGFLNSLGSALVTREAETLGGVQKDIDVALKFLLKEQDGKSNYLAHFLMQLQKTGPQGEDFLNYLGGVVGKYKGGKELDNELTKIADRLSKIRNDKDVEAYAAQFINAPQSEAVRFGANITDLSDVLAKETYYRHLTENEGMSPEKARIKVLDSFPNYIENMPLAVQQLSDVGVIMFPSFWMRIQKIIYRMAKDRPVSLATEEMIDSYFNLHADTILDSNIINKATSWGGILHSPLEVVGAGSIFPLHAL